MVVLSQSQWQKIKLGDVSTISRGSSPRPIANQKYFVDGNIPWIKIADATKSGKYLYETKEHVNSYGASFSRLLPKGSLIVAASGTLGYTQFLGVDGCVHDGWLIVNPYESKLNKDFLYYKLIEQQKYFYNSAYGAAIQNVNTGILKDLEIDLPELEVQSAISDILSTYDNLIENINRRIKIIESIAQKVYTEWFVKNAEISKGWQMEYLDKIIDINPPCKTGVQKSFRKIAMDRLSSDLMLIDTNEIESMSKGTGTKFKNYDVLFARITPCLQNGKTGYVQFLDVDEVAIGSTEFVVMRGNKVPSTFVYCLARDVNFRNAAEKTMRGASGRQRVSNDFFKQYKVALPPSNTLTKFHDLVSPMFTQVEILRKSIQNLRKTRDVLIPQLVTGKLQIKS